MIDLIDRKDENYYPKVFLEKYYFIEHMKIFCINFDEECYDEECINFFKKTLRKKKKKVRHFFYAWDFATSLLKH